MAQTWIAAEGLTDLSEQVDRISDDLAGARRGLARTVPGDLGWLAERYSTVTGRCLDALQTASQATSESAVAIMDCHHLYRQTDGEVELWFKGLAG